MVLSEGITRPSTQHPIKQHVVVGVWLVHWLVQKWQPSNARQQRRASAGHQPADSKTTPALNSVTFTKHGTRLLWACLLALALKKQELEIAKVLNIVQSHLDAIEHGQLDPCGHESSFSPYLSQTNMSYKASKLKHLPTCLHTSIMSSPSPDLVFQASFNQSNSVRPNAMFRGKSLRWFVLENDFSDGLPRKTTSL